MLVLGAGVELLFGPCCCMPELGDPALMPLSEYACSRAVSLPRATVNE